MKQSTKHSSSLLGVLDKRAPIIVVEGLSTEAVVGISIASFIIGVGLMATLWYIYMKTGWYKNQAVAKFSMYIIEKRCFPAAIIEILWFIFDVLLFVFLENNFDDNEFLINYLVILVYQALIDHSNTSNTYLRWV